jgi:hypothetical protein
MTREEIVFALLMMVFGIVAYAALCGSSRFFWAVMFTVLAFGILISVRHLMQNG